jgi:hypothetical protein
MRTERARTALSGSIGHRSAVARRRCPPRSNPPPVPRRPRPRAAPPTCSTARHDDLGCPVVADQSIPLRVAKRRSDRRSDDGQVILEGPSAGRKLEPDLLVCRAPLRNRTVDLLLTMNPRVHAVANWDDAGQVSGGALCCRPTYLFIKLARLGGVPVKPVTEGKRACERIGPTSRVRS